MTLPKNRDLNAHFCYAVSTLVAAQYFLSDDSVSRDVCRRSRVPVVSPTRVHDCVSTTETTSPASATPDSQVEAYSFAHLHAGMWSRSRGLGLETVSRTKNVSSRSRAISCRWSRRFVRRARSVTQYSRRRPIQTNLP